MKLNEFIRTHAIQTQRTEGSDVGFFGVKAVPGTSADELRALVKAHVGDFGDIDMFNGEEHSYLQVGGFVGDQGGALLLMGLGHELGLWDLLTPKTMFGSILTPELESKMLGMGYVTIKAKEAA